MKLQIFLIFFFNLLISSHSIFFGRRTNSFRYVANVNHGDCTGVFVGNHAMITAAHCAHIDLPQCDGRRHSNIGIRVGNVRAEACLYINDYAKNARTRSSLDILLVKFPNTRRGRRVNYMHTSIASRTPNRRSTVKIIGFGENDCCGMSHPRPRVYGANTISDIMFGQIAINSYRALFGQQREAICRRGDSGGPMLNSNNELIGIAKRTLSVEKVTNDMSCSYIEINDPQIKQFLIDASRRMAITLDWAS